MSRIIWSESALRDLRGIDQYLSGHDPDAASRILRAIRARAEQLRSYPASGPALEGDARSLTILGTPYVIIYRLESGGAEILRVRHGREHWRGA